MSKLTATIKHEFMEMLPPTLYFLIILHIVALIRALMIRGEGLGAPTVASVTITALVLGKSVLIANMLPFVNRFPEKPLIWNIGWKTALYTLIALFMHYLEHLYDYWKVAPGFVAANQRLLMEMNWPRFWAIQILLVMLIVAYCTGAELARLVGHDKLRAMFFGPMNSAPQNQTARQP
jgi:hypothetical protein